MSYYFCKMSKKERKNWIKFRNREWNSLLSLDLRRLIDATIQAYGDASDEMSGAYEEKTCKFALRLLHYRLDKAGIR